MKGENNREYILKLQSDGKNSAKTPPIFLPEDGVDVMTNDYAEYLNKIEKKLNNE